MRRNFTLLCVLACFSAPAAPPCIERVNGTGELQGPFYNTQFELRFRNREGHLSGLLRYQDEPGQVTIRSTKVTGYTVSNDCRIVEFDLRILEGGSGKGTGRAVVCDDASGVDTIAVTFVGPFINFDRYELSGTVVNGDITITQKNCP